MGLFLSFGKFNNFFFKNLKFVVLILLELNLDCLLEAIFLTQNFSLKILVMR